MTMKRRDFLKAVSATGVAAAVGPTVFVRDAWAAGKLDLGAVKSVKVDVISETSWFDNDRFKSNMTDGGGASTNQYTIPWDPENSGGYSALITVTTLQGEEKRILLDSGWNNAWMDYVFEKKGIPGMLQRGEIDFMVLSHWHLDHLWGIESTLKHNPNVKIIAPGTHYPEDLALLREKSRFTAKDPAGREVVLAKNDVPHRGELVLTKPEGQDGAGLYKLMPGVALKLFDVPILLRVRGENVLYFNVQDKGIVTVTGCCHPGILSLFSFARQNFAGYEPYGAYGGLHLSLFETWDPKFDDVIAGVKAFKLKKVAANHCTGWLWAEKAAANGVPMVKGTDTYKSYKRQSLVARASNAYLTNGDSVTF
jgi:7,8-dihydropterin-6-yl-methyl-4-(beta-D-ribofuranosyl)aminobenzene 5'-phosphate synthase